MKKFLFAVPLVLLLLFNCEYFNLMSFKEWMENTGNDEVDVYCAGYYTSGVDHACYWKNQELIELQDNSYTSQTESIFIYGSDIYVAGICNTIGAYWKNEEIHYLSDSIGLFSIFVKSGMVYLGGRDGGGYPAVWIDGKKTRVNSSLGGTTSIFVDDNLNLYAGGLAGSNGFYWVNNKIITFSTNTQVTSIFVKNNDVHCSGVLTTGPNGYYWENDNLIFDGGAKTNFYAIHVNGSDIYIAGQDSNVPNAYYWKNGDPILLDVGYGGSEAWFLTEFDGNIYLCGRSYAPGNPACYWINNQEQILLPDYTLGSEAKSIYVKRKKY